jgi:hypothetical protein
MIADPERDLEAFHRFLGEQLTNEGSCLTPEECLVLWRARHPFPQFPASDKNDSASGRTSSNASLLAALAEIDEIQREMNPTKSSPTQDYLDEARSGAMYGNRSGDEPEADRP